MIHNDFSISFKRRSLFPVIMAIIFSVLINFVLFGLMPALVKKEIHKPENHIFGNQVNLVRIKKKDSKVKRKQIIKPVKKTKPLKKRVAPKVFQKQPLPKMPSLPFQLNPKLPAGPGIIPVLPIVTSPALIPQFKNFYGVNELDNQLTPIVQGPPFYPLNAKRRGIQGSVKVQFIVTEQGTVRDIQILQAIPENIFDQSVIRCIAAWRFSSGRIEGRPVKTRVITTIRFELE